MVTKRIRKQQRGGCYIAAIWTAILVFLAYIAYQIFLNGTGNSSGGRGFGLKGKVNAILRDMEAQGHGELVKWIMIAVCIAVGIYVMARIVSALRLVAPMRTVLGQSICRQAEPNESFSELCRLIDQDMENGNREFGAGVFVSSSWIMEDEIMRLNRVQKIYDKVSSGEKTLVLEDVDGHAMTIELFMQEWALELLEYIKKALPTVPIVGGNEPPAVVVGKMYSWHVEKTEEQVRRYEEKAKQGQAHAQTEYAKCLLFGKGGISADGAAAYVWFRKAADQSDEIAKMYIGHCLLYGIGVDKDENEGYRMLNCALEYNYPEESSSQPLADYSTFENEDLVQLFWDLGDAMENSLGVERNYSVAAYYFNMMDDWGHPEGAERMRCYKKGISGWKKIDG